MAYLIGIAHLEQKLWNFEGQYDILLIGIPNTFTVHYLKGKCKFWEKWVASVLKVNFFPSKETIPFPSVFTKPQIWFTKL